MTEYLPEQDELRCRLRAARALRNLTVAQLAERIPASARLGERTLRKLENGESQLTPPVLRELAVRLDLPYAWFTVPDLGAAIGGETFDERLAALEYAQKRLWELAAGQAPPPLPGEIRHSAPGTPNA
jgi:transcriptional regulator with XRE-family HTH domain